MSNSKRTHTLFTGSLFAAGLLSGAYGLNASAQQRGDSEWQISLGAGAMEVASPWTGANNQVVLVPYLDISKGNWHVNGDNLLGYQMQLDQSWGISVGLGVRNDGYDSLNLALNELSEHPLFDGYEEPDTEAVVNLGITYGWLSLDASRDVSNNSQSDSLSLSADIPIYHANNGLDIAASASIDWYDSHYVNYYYGVAGKQIDNSVGRVGYETGAAVNFGLGIRALVPISERWSMTGIISRTKLDNDIANSPLVDANYQDTAVLMFVFEL